METLEGPTEILHTCHYKGPGDTLLYGDYRIVCLSYRIVLHACTWVSYRIVSHLMVYAIVSGMGLVSHQIAIGFLIMGIVCFYS